MPRAWVYGDKIDTDLLAPGQYMKLPAEELARQCLEAIDPAFAANVVPGDIIVAGRDFGLGSSREQAAVSLKMLGISAVLAVSFARIFYRNAINIGLPAIVFPHVDAISAGDEVRVDIEGGAIENVTRGTSYRVAPLPPNLAAMMRAGGLLPYTRQRLDAARVAERTAGL